MSSWLDVLSDWTGIRSNILVPVLVFGVVVVVVVAGAVAFALGTIIQATRRERARQNKADRST